MSDAPMPITSGGGTSRRHSIATGLGRSIDAPAGGDYPRVHLDWHEGNGFVFQRYENAEPWSDFLVASGQFSTPSVEVEVGGQALERWPPELFVPAGRAARALNHFLDYGKQDPALEWIRIDGFPREALWEGRAQREGWNVRIPAKDMDDCLKAHGVLPDRRLTSEDVQKGLRRGAQPPSWLLPPPPMHYTVVHASEN